jgi:excisionase family DNA binding protein
MAPTAYSAQFSSAPSRRALDLDPSFTRNDLLTPADLAAVLQVQRSTALDYLRRGVIPGRKIGRNWFVLRSQLDAYLADLFDMES